MPRQGWRREPSTGSGSRRACSFGAAVVDVDPAHGPQIRSPWASRPIKAWRSSQDGHDATSRRTGAGWPCNGDRTGRPRGGRRRRAAHRKPCSDAWTGRTALADAGAVPRPRGGRLPGLPGRTGWASIRIGVPAPLDQCRHLMTTSPICWAGWPPRRSCRRSWLRRWSGTARPGRWRRCGGRRPSSFERPRCRRRSQLMRVICQVGRDQRVGEGLVDQ